MWAFGTKLFLAPCSWLWEQGIWNPLEPQPGQSRASLGVTCWICYTVDLRKRGRILNAGWKGGGLRPFYSSEFPSDLVRRQSGALKTCHMREETEIGSSILSQDLRTGCYKTVSEFSPLGKLLTSWRRTPDPVENLMSYKKLESLGTILRKLRSMVSPGHPPRTVFSSPTSVTPAPLLEGSTVDITLAVPWPRLTAYSERAMCCSVLDVSRPFSLQSG